MNDKAIAIDEILKTRRSIRNFNDKPIPEDILFELVEAANFAPSNCNTQDWRFIIITDKKLLNDLVDNGGSVIISNSTAGILICYNSQSDNTEYLDWLQTASAAAQNIQLKAHSLECGSCWICHLPAKKTIRKMFNIPRHYSPVCFIALGYYNTIPKNVARKNSVKDIAELNKFPSKYTPFEKKIFFKCILRKIYYILPKFIKVILNPAIDKFFVKKFKN